MLKKIFLAGLVTGLAMVAAVFGRSPGPFSGSTWAASSGSTAPVTVAVNAAVPQAEVQPAGETAAESESTEVKSAVMDIDVNDAGNVSLDFRDADIKSVLKVLAFKSKVNIIAGPEVVGLVNIQLKNVPWKKALDVILSTYGYSYEQKGSIITVTTVDNLKKRREDAKSLADQEPLSMETFVLNFSRAEDVVKALERMKTPRGSINFDKRTNSLIVSDVDSNLQTIREVVRRLDSVTPQVLIEAKIVETSLGKNENMGIDWNVVAGAAGARVPTIFPFNVHSSNQYLPVDFPLPPTATLFPTTSDKGYFTYGTLDLSQFSAVMQMLKTRSDVNVISNPRIVTLDNQAATIKAGSQYPLPQYVYNQQSGALQISGWNYIDIGVTFVVTPHVNGQGLVTIEIEPTVTDILSTVTMGSGASTILVPQLSSESAKTSVMIQDGQTLFIAGLIKDKKSDVRTKVPILGDIPLLGLPFQKKTASVTKSELVIFLTPHIITPSSEKK